MVYLNPDQLRYLIMKVDNKQNISDIEPANPTIGQLWYSSNSPDNIALRIWNGSKWKAIQLMDIE